jgi:AraC-like DNA-binding protein
MGRPPSRSSRALQTCCLSKRFARGVPLRDGRYSLMQIAGRVGYDTDTALNRAFKRTQGVAPGEWRRREREALTA